LLLYGVAMIESTVGCIRACLVRDIAGMKSIRLYVRVWSSLDTVLADRVSVMRRVSFYGWRQAACRRRHIYGIAQDGRHDT
jgi:hypothetical protein